MVFKFITSLKDSEKGITLIEIVVVVFIITMFSVILIANFPKIQRQYALSRATYQLAQNLRRVQDLGLSGVKLRDDDGNIVDAKGYGIYVVVKAEEYILYGDSCSVVDRMYTISSSICGELNHDYIIETINFNDENAGVFISEIRNIVANSTSINFSPPNPYIEISNLGPNENSVEIVLSLFSDLSNTRIVSVNTSGLIEVK